MTSLFGQKVFCCVIALIIASFSENIKLLFRDGLFNQTFQLYIHSLAISSWIGTQAWVIFVAGKYGIYSILKQSIVLKPRLDEQFLCGNFLSWNFFCPYK